MTWITFNNIDAYCDKKAAFSAFSLSIIKHTDDFSVFLLPRWQETPAWHTSERTQPASFDYY